MATYAVDDLTYGPATLALCAAWLETQLELLDSTLNPIRHIGIKPVARDRDLCIAVLVTDT
jgi:hypothetical protein